MHRQVHVHVYILIFLKAALICDPEAAILSVPCLLYISVSASIYRNQGRKVTLGKLQVLFLVPYPHHLSRFYKSRKSYTLRTSLSQQISKFVILIVPQCASLRCRIQIYAALVQQTKVGWTHQK